MKQFPAAFLMFIAFSLSAQVPPNWDTNPPANTAEITYSTGVSIPSANEQEAYKSAWNNALQNFASSIGTYFKGQTDISVRSETSDSQIEDANILYIETSSFSTQVQLTGMRELARKAERQGGQFVVRVLTAMSGEDFRKATQYIENEEAAYLAYRFFAQKTSALAAPDINNKPKGFADYYTWLRNTCVIITVNDNNQNSYMEQLDAFIKKLYRSAVVFAQSIDGQPGRIIYDAPKYYNGMLRALQNLSLFTDKRENARIFLTPRGEDSLVKFRTAITNMKDSSKIFVTGLEVINTQNRSIANTGSLVVNQFKTLASRFNMSAVNFSLPSRFISETSIDEDSIISHIRDSADFPARYAAIVHAETNFEPGLPEYKIPPMVTASCFFTLYDVLTGEILQSSQADTKGFVLAPANMQEQNIITESRRALQFLYDAKNQPGLLGTMKDVFEKL